MRNISDRVAGNRALRVTQKLNSAGFNGREREGERDLLLGGIKRQVVKKKKKRAVGDAGTGRSAR